MAYPNDPSGPQPPYGGPSGGQPPYGNPPGGQPPYGAPSPYGNPPGGQPPYGNPPGGQPPYGAGGYEAYPGAYGPPPGGQPPKQGMSTGTKVGIGIGGCFGLVLVVLLVFGIIALASGGDETDTASQSSGETGAAEEGAGGGGGAEAPAAEGEVSMTATRAGTTGDVLEPDSVYTVVDVTITNNSDEALDMNPLYFTVVLDDGTETNDWGASLFADMTHFETGSLAPGDSVSGQVAAVGEVVVTEVRYDPSFGMKDPIVTQVQ
ncbi:DUF4352 domain-containing protein [Nocardiopsis algeriensis]|uniref:DUF4352 domain-containing protein n=1 Tax=Nocardiopsis algeriensis TaxID=1478215 RepID=A0A841IQC8_9ACTN|nr:DUF4352 domain-containing protein [Nocardiopsis algeriensis]MBB6121049.1 hypothetical protein [Nocardiopsis algeriensis]